MTGTTATWSNWAGNQHSSALLTVRPRSVSDVVEAVRQAAAAGRTVRATGSGHSFTATAVADGHRIDLANWRQTSPSMWRAAWSPYRLE